MELLGIKWGASTSRTARSFFSRSSTSLRAERICSALRAATGGSRLDGSGREGPEPQKHFAIEQIDLEPRVFMLVGDSLVERLVIVQQEAKSMSASNRIVAVALVCVAALTPLSAGAQAHQVQEGGYTLRSSTVGSETLPASVAKAHGFDQEPGLSILNVTVTKNGRVGNGTLPAALDVQIRDLAGRAVPIEMRVDRENGYVSYYGIYRRPRHQTLVVAIAAAPKGSSRTLKLRYRDR
ncbi:MAG: DUF4426 domain-containing protein [Caldimonas sp.]